MAQPTGITVVTGFLGAGKTTLVNYVLNADHGYRVAVILNEFGAELGIEKMLIEDKDDGDNAVEEWVELNNGCVCCTVKGSLIQTIDSLLEKRAASGKKFDFILLETTGLADPGPVAQELWVDDELLEEDSAVLDDAPLSPVHDVNIRTVCLAVEGRVDERKFESWLEGILWEQQGGCGGGDDASGGEGGGGGGGGGGGTAEPPPLEVLRAKGLLFVAEEEGEGGEVRDVKKIVQAVREVYEITPGPPFESPGERKLNKVVLIGRGLMEEKLLQGLQETLA